MLLRTVVSLVEANFSRSVTQIRKLAQLPQTMKAIGLYKHLDINNPESLQDVEVNVPKVENTNVLVEVKAVAMNPLDTRIRSPGPGKPEYSTPKILGWDGAGKVVDRGNNVQEVNVGDEVYFVGEIAKNGANAQFVALDKTLVAKKPSNLSFEEAAAVPLVAVTAYEVIFDRMRISTKDKGKSLLIINSAGGVGSVASQLAKEAGLKVIGTASRPETQEFSKKLGADVVLNHSQDLVPQLEAAGFREVDYILINFDPTPYWETAMKAIKAQGTIGLLVDSSQPLDLRVVKDKSLTIAYEMMNTRIKYDTPDKDRTRQILTEVSKLIENGKLKVPLSKVLSPINATNLKEAHKIMENKSMIGKLVLSGF